MSTDYLKRPFIYPERIPAGRATAVRHLAEYDLDDQVLNVMYEWVEEVGVVCVLRDMASILECNGIGHILQAKIMNLWAIRTGK